MKERDSIARVDVAAAGPPPLAGPKRGTGALIGDKLVLTALHVVADRAQDPPELYAAPIRLTFPGKTVRAEVVPGMWSRTDDWVLLRCEEDPGVAPLPLHELDADRRGIAWETFGFPDLMPEGMHLDGTIKMVEGKYQNAVAIQLSCDILTGTHDVKMDGISGAPVLVAGAVVGVLRSGLMRPDDRTIKAATIYACPAKLVLDGPTGDLPLRLRNPRRRLSLSPGDRPAHPYLGLAAYKEAHAEIFFGRGQQICDLYGKLRAPNARPILLLYGQSGVGKSSLLEAGLIPQFRSSHDVLSVRRDPDLGLRASFEAAIQQSGYARRERAARPLLVIVDQVEQAYTSADAAQNPDAELDDLVQAIAELFDAATPKAPVQLVLGFRIEWLGQILARLDAKNLAYDRYPLNRIDREGILEVVRLGYDDRLRKHYGLEIKEDVADEIAGDLLNPDLDSPVAPTLQLLMRHLWDEARTEATGESIEIRLDRYTALRQKGIHLARFLDRAIEGLPPEHQPHVGSGLVEDLLREHVTVHPAAASARTCSRGDLEDLYANIKPKAFAGLLRALQQSYVLTILPASSVAPEPRTRLAHDTLAPLVLTRWRESQAPGPRARRLLEALAGEWKDENKQGRTLDEIDLGQVSEGLAGMRALEPAEERLLEASRRAIRRKEQEAEQRMRRDRALKTGATMSATGMALFGIFALWQGCEAQRAGESAVTRSLQGNASFLMAQGGTNLQTAALLAAEGLKREWSPEGDATARSILSQMLEPAWVSPPDGWIESITLSKKRDIVALVREKRGEGASRSATTLTVVSTRDGSKLDSVVLGSIKNSAVVNISDDGERIAVAASGTLWLRDWRSRSTVRTAKIKAERYGDILFNGSNGWMAATTEDGVAIYKLPEATVQTLLPLRARSIDSQARFSPLHESLLIVRDDQDVVSLIDVTSGETLSSFAVEESSADTPARPYNPNVESAFRSSHPNKGIDLSPDGNILSIDLRGGRSLWHIGSGVPRRLEEDDPSLPANLDGNSRFVATLDKERKLIVKEMDENGAAKVLKTAALSFPSAFRVEMSLDGMFLIESVSDDTPRIWDWRAGALLGRAVHDRGASNVKVADPFLVTTGGDGRLAAWRFPGGRDDRLQRRFELPLGWRRPVTSRSGGVIAFTGDDGAVFVWTPGHDPEIKRLPWEGMGMRFRPVISQNEQAIVVAGDSRVTVFGLPDREARWTLELPLKIADGPRTGNERKRWITVPSEEAGRQLFGAFELKESVPVTDVTRLYAKPVCPTPAYVDRKVHVTPSGTPETGTPADSSPVDPRINAVAVSPRGDRLAVSSGDMAWIYDIPAKRRIAQFSLGYTLARSMITCDNREFVANIEGMTFNGDGTRLTLWNDQNVLWSWNEPDAAPKARRQFFWGQVLQGKSHVVISSSEAATVVALDLDNTRTIPAKGYPEAVSPDDSLIAIKEFSRRSEGEPEPWSTLKIVSVARGEEVASFPYEAEIRDVVFSPDGRLVAASGSDNGVHVWDIQAKKGFARIPAQGRALTGIGFLAPDVLFTLGHGSGTVRLHPLGTEKLIAEICRRSVRNLREDELETYLGGKNYPPTCPDLRWDKAIP
jgi:WD40 repeat protein